MTQAPLWGRVIFSDWHGVLSRSQVIAEMGIQLDRRFRDLASAGT